MGSRLCPCGECPLTQPLAAAARRCCWQAPLLNQPSLTPSFLTPSPILMQREPIPVELPVLTLTEGQIKVGQYGLTVVAPRLAAAGGPLAEELKAFFTWSTTSIMLNRPNRLQHSGNQM